MSYDKRSSQKSHPRDNMLLVASRIQVTLHLPPTLPTGGVSHQPNHHQCFDTAHSCDLKAGTDRHYPPSTPITSREGVPGSQTLVSPAYTQHGIPSQAAYCRVAIVTYRPPCLGISLPGEKADLVIVFFVSSRLKTGAPRGISTHLGNWRLEKTGSWIHDGRC